MRLLKSQTTNTRIITGKGVKLKDNKVIIDGDELVLTKGSINVSGNLNNNGQAVATINTTVGIVAGLT